MSPKSFRLRLMMHSLNLDSAQDDVSRETSRLRALAPKLAAPALGAAPAPASSRLVLSNRTSRKERGAAPAPGCPARAGVSRETLRARTSAFAPASAFGLSATGPLAAVVAFGLRLRSGSSVRPGSASLAATSGSFPIPRLLLLAVLALALMTTFAGCGGLNGAAATVNGAVISEQEVADYVQSRRVAQGLEDAADWRAYLNDSGQTSAEIRDQVVDLLISREILRQGADDLGVRVTGDELDEAVAVKRRTYESDAQWKQALAAAGLDEQTYRGEVELDLLSSKVAQALAEDPERVREAIRDTEDTAYDEVGDAVSSPDGASGGTPGEVGASPAGDGSSDGDAAGGAANDPAAESARAQAALTWLANLRAQADITINAAPSSLPY